MGRSCCCATAASGIKGRCGGGFEAAGELADGHVLEAVGRQAQQPPGAALHYHFAVITEASGQELCHHPEAAAAALCFLN